MQPPIIWTIGHSTRPLDEFVGLLRGERIELLADVRRYPASRLHPHFNAEALRRSLIAADLRYEGYPDERWLDIAHYKKFAPIIEKRIAMCARKGFDAVEPDNINGWENKTGFPLTGAK